MKELKELILKIIKNDAIFWVFFICLTILMVLYVLKKEGIKITITFSEPYNNKVISIFGD